MAAPKLEHFLLCEHASVDQTGLLNLAGMMFSPIRVQGPGLLPKLVCVLVVTGVAGSTQCRVTMELRAQDVLAREQTTIARPDPSQDRHVFLHNLTPFPLPSQGSYVIKFGLDFGQDRAAVYSYRLEVQFAAPPAPAS